MDLDFAAARQADSPCRFVGDAEIEQLRFAVLHRLIRRRDDFVFDAAARNRSGEAAVLAHDKPPPRRTRGRAPSRHDCRRGDALSFAAPTRREVQQFDVLGCYHASNSGANTLPGFIIPRGSSARLIAAIARNAAGFLRRASNAVLVCPIPCSALKEPPPCANAFFLSGDFFTRKRGVGWRLV